MANRYWVGGTGTWTAINTANWSASSGGASGASVPTAADSVFFDQAATYTVTMTNTSGALTCLDFTISAGTVTIAGGAIGAFTISGSMSIIASTIWNSVGTITFNSTTAATITTNGVPIKANGLTFSITGSLQLLDALTHTGVLETTWNSGTLNLNSKVFTTSRFISNVTSVRTLSFGTGNITLSSSGTTNIASTNLTITGTPQLIYTYAGATAVNCQTGAQSESTSISVKFTAGTYLLGFLLTSGSTAKNVDFTGFAGTLDVTNLGTIYGNLTLSTGMSLTASANTMTFGATSGTQIITSNAKTIDFPIAFNGIGGTFQLFDNMTLGATRATTLTNGTLDLNGKTLTTGLFSSTNSNTRTIAFGTSNIICNAAGGTLWSTGTPTNLTVTGTPVVNISNSGAVATTVASGTLTEAQAISFNFTTGTYALTFLSFNYSAKNVNFTGFAGTWNARTVASTIYGSLTLSTGMTFAASSGVLTFGATSGTQIVTTNGKTIDEPLTFNGVGGTVQLADALLMGTTRTLTHTNGTIDLNGKTLTVGTAYTTATGTKNLTFNGGTLVCPTAATTAFNNAVPTGFTTTAGTGTGNISMTGATAKTFVGGGSTYNCTLSNDGAGALTISGSNTFTTIANGVQPTAFVFPISVTQTVTNWTVSGTAGNLVTITSGTAGTAATLSKASGTVSSNYLSLKDSAATGGAAWYAGANSTNVSGNSGWIFSNAPANAAGSFFFMF